MSTHEQIMKEWDYWRKVIADGNKSSLPRDWFENLINVLMEKGDWVSVSDRLPDRKGCYLTVDITYNVYKVLTWYEEGWEKTWGGFESYITHWMPIPNPPDAAEITFIGDRDNER